MSLVQMYPSVGALPIAAVKAAMGVSGAASPPPPRAPRPRPRPAAADGFAPALAGKPAAPRPAAADGFTPAPAGKPTAGFGAATGGGRFRAATTGARSSSVDHRRIWILTGLPTSLTFADDAVSVTSLAGACSAR